MEGRGEGIEGRGEGKEGGMEGRRGGREGRREGGWEGEGRKGDKGNITNSLTNSTSYLGNGSSLDLTSVSHMWSSTQIYERATSTGCQ